MLHNLRNQLNSGNFFIPFLMKDFKVHKSFSAENIHKIEHEKLCRSEIQLQFTHGFQCPNPSTLTQEDWQYIFRLPNKHQRARHYKYLFNKKSNHSFKNEAHSIRNVILDETHTKILDERAKNDHIWYGLGQNSLLLRINRTKLNKLKNFSLLRSKVFGQKMIIDCTFDNEMNDREIRNATYHLEQSYTANREHIRPFNLHLFGSESSKTIIEAFHKRVPTLGSNNLGAEIHFNCYTEMFPRDRLLVLTSDSDRTLEEYNGNDIYVVGGIADRGNSKPMMLAKAKQLGLRTARLPLQRYGFHSISELPLNAVVNMLGEFQMTRSWKKIVEAHGPKMIREKEYRFQMKSGHINHYDDEFPKK